jgi:hypothetical protein
MPISKTMQNSVSAVKADGTPANRAHDLTKNKPSLKPLSLLQWQVIAFNPVNRVPSALDPYSAESMSRGRAAM